ncbi:MAG: ribonuclease HII [Candidatus Marinimicrobia bacterium]|nr:ribonuclease HII [Candidatus Neomarinimicrobiota bacterium]
MLGWEQTAWQAGYQRVAGVDEAGGGPWAGPVVAAAVVFDRAWLADQGLAALAGLTDSKQLSPRRRAYFYDCLATLPAVRWAVGAASVEEIDVLNILRATHLAMRRALAGLNPGPDYALVDGRPVPDLPVPAQAIVKGDAASFSIAAASVMAKVTRDRLLEVLAGQYPLYGFARHRGYGTPQHQAALRQYGPCPAHRRSFAPVRACLEPPGAPAPCAEACPDPIR